VLLSFIEIRRMNKFVVLFFSFSAVAVSCTKNTLAVKADDLAGTWLLKQYSGGFAGRTYSPNDSATISFTPLRKYTSTVNDTIVATGDYVLFKANEQNIYFSTTLINLSSAEGSKITYGIVVKNDSLFLDEGCCDRLTYIYTRKK
jgi:hypothetical protein